MIAAYRPMNMIHVNVRIRNMRQVWIVVRWAYVFTIEVTMFCISLVYSGGSMLTVFFKIMLVFIAATCLAVQPLLRKYK